MLHSKGWTKASTTEVVLLSTTNSFRLHSPPTLIFPHLQPAVHLFPREVVISLGQESQPFEQFAEAFSVFVSAIPIIHSPCELLIVDDNSHSTRFGGHLVSTLMTCISSFLWGQGSE